MTTRRHLTRGFTIIELGVVIVIIGILATIILVVYGGIKDNARKATLMSDLDNAVSVLALDLKRDGSYPATVALADKGNGLPVSSGTTYQYIVGASGSSPTFCLTATNSNQAYTISQDGSSVAGSCNLLQNSSIEKTGVNEFLQYADLAPIFGQYGLVPYTLSFDIKSANITNKNTALVYMQNGSGAEYSFINVNVPVTTSYVRQTLTATPSIANSSLTQSILAFYGTYATGNILSVKNVKISLGTTTNSAWTPAP